MRFTSQCEALKTSCTDRELRETLIPPSFGAPRPRGRERMGVPSLGFMDIRGILRKRKEQKRTNQKIENSKKNVDSGLIVVRRVFSARRNRCDVLQEVSVLLRGHQTFVDDQCFKSGFLKWLALAI
jgi:hypothetical protein